ncbi:DUF5667 domain-containing protein [Ktedonobacter robiniae]|uniref:DUF5667 domain-containing protein n=1 Tax=Ktedonobacter robiniae TaxID=2778365 RepID=A0ABQ3UM25_9CHLR|nr:DUF5667 domain-containing protein [Ktedonobacter robiniae]GHO53774.1 hypothetical protein KSB_22490 [Ktedonobacter robiniae]
MKPLSELLNTRLEEHMYKGHLAKAPGFMPPPVFFGQETEVDELVKLAQRVRTHPAIQPDPEFARRLETRLRAHAYTSQQKRPAGFWWQFRFLQPLSTPLALAAILLCLVLGTAGVALAAQTATPNTPLYGVKSWIQQVQMTLINSPADQAELHLRIVRDHLTALKSAAAASQQDVYLNELTELEQQLTTATQSVGAIPPGKDHTLLSQELATTQTNVRQTLRNLLPALKTTAQLATTEALEHLGEQVTHLQSATVILSPSSHGQVTIILSGTHFQSGARLWINNQPVNATGSIQQGTYVFLVEWRTERSIKTIYLSNPDATLVRTGTIMITTASPDNGNGKANTPGSNNKGSGNNGNGNNTHDHGSGNQNTGNGKPGVDPTPHH